MKRSSLQFSRTGSAESRRERRHGAKAKAGADAGRHQNSAMWTVGDFLPLLKLDEPEPHREAAWELAWEAMDDFYRARLIRHARGQFGCTPEDAEDVAQHCLVGWYRSFTRTPQKWPPHRSIWNSLKKSAFHAHVDLLRSRRHGEPCAEIPDDAAAPAPDAACLAGRALTGGAVRDCLARLPDHRREILLLHLVEELSTREIAGRRGMTRGTVANRITDATELLRACLSGRHAWVGWESRAEAVR